MLQSRPDATTKQMSHDIRLAWCDAPLSFSQVTALISIFHTSSCPLLHQVLSSHYPLPLSPTLLHPPLNNPTRCSDTVSTLQHLHVLHYNHKPLTSSVGSTSPWCNVTSQHLTLCACRIYHKSSLFCNQVWVIFACVCSSLSHPVTQQRLTTVKSL